MELCLQIGIVHTPANLIALLLYRCVPAVLVFVYEYVQFSFVCCLLGDLCSFVHHVFPLFLQVSEKSLSQRFLLILMLLLVEVGIIVLKELYQPLCVRLEVDFHYRGIGVDDHSAQLRLEDVELFLMFVLSILIRFGLAVAAILVLVLLLYRVNLLRILLIIAKHIVNDIKHHAKLLDPACILQFGVVANNDAAREKFVLQVFGNELYCDVVLRTVRDYQVGITHGRLDEVNIGLSDEAIVRFEDAFDVATTFDDVSFYSPKQSDVRVRIDKYFEVHQVAQIFVQ